MQKSDLKWLELRENLTVCAERHKQLRLLILNSEIKMAMFVGTKQQIQLAN